MSASPGPDGTPAHVAIIMDGNGRWATARGLPRSAGHRQGVEALRRTVRAAAEQGLRVLTLYSFSTENWSRPQAEVRFLLELLRRFIRTDVAELHQANVRVMIIGGRDGLETGLRAMFEEAEALTRGNTGLKLVIAFNYGSRQEIARAVQALAARVAEGLLAPAAITPELISGELDTAGLADPDLLIRTGGEQRISNFLLWQCAYTEFVFLPEYWPEFDGQSLARAIGIFRGRDRRFGGLKAQTA
ncbi:MAG: isoprenyl transferase [Aestuariivirga sp.]|uniref:isoprenyl transferase n=1 Tax=Aestuariivirga sp. TaxID=2650926 RepID=UPI0025B9922A|nr:isoprenyl transferase [Aestuariivirga sp.]MCA3562571.1 isoprenyl transferase [Aestuariivirga sp.]